MIKQQQNNAALYLRLSRDDGGDAESNSIGNQRAILQRYAEQSGFVVSGEYIDDGISGTTFERPSFKRMIGDIDDGKIGIVLCKDLSRLGRNNALVAYYTEIFFIENNVRFIALNDGIDTFKGDNEIMPFKSVINEYYARDISKKIKSAYKAQGHKGAYTGMVAPYGYMKNPEVKYHLIPDPNTAPILQRMFKLAAEGNSMYRIAKIFTSEEILKPSAYFQQEFGVEHRETYKSDTEWTASSLRGMLVNRVYLGHMVSGKRTTKSFKSKKTVPCAPEDQIVVENTHEALVDEKTFELAQRVLGVKQRGNKHGFVNIFVGFIKCADCGSGLAQVSPAASRPGYGYNCNRYRHKYCTNHFITYESVYQIVLTAIQDKLTFVKEHESELAEYAKKLSTQSTARDLKYAKNELSKSTKRRDELDVLIQRLFEQNAVGLLTDERFLTLSGTYEKEQQQLKEKIAILQARVSEQEQDSRNVMRFFETVRKHTEITELSREILTELIDSVVVHEPSKGTGYKQNRKQKVVVNFRFINDQWFTDDLLSL